MSLSEEQVPPDGEQEQHYTREATRVPARAGGLFRAGGGPAAAARLMSDAENYVSTCPIRRRGTTRARA